MIARRRWQKLQTILKRVALIALVVLPCILFIGSPYSAAEKDLLTAEEREWLEKNKEELTLVISNWPPYDYFDESGKHSGYVADYIALVEKKLNIHFRIVPTKTWAESEALAREHKVAVITCMNITPEREKYFNFAGPFRVVPISIITRDTEKENLSLEKMGGKSVAVVKGYFTAEVIQQKYPNIIIQTVPDELVGVRNLSIGRTDALINDVGTVSFYAHRAGIVNLQVAGDTEYNYILNFGIRKDWPLLWTSLLKGVQSISQEENDLLYRKSVYLERRSLWETEEFWLIVAGISTAAGLIIGLVILWNLTLRKRVEQRTRELARSEEELLKHRDNLEQLVQERAQGLLAANQELTAMNEEMMAMNEEMTSLNAILEDSNQRLEEQIEFRRQIENDLVVRERQYRASINLLTSSAAEIDKLFESILQDALKQVNAPGGTIGLIDETGKLFVIRNAAGSAANIVSMSYPATEGVFGRVRETGEAAYQEDYQQLSNRFADHKLDCLTSLIMVPLKQQGLVIGAFTAMWFDEVHLVSSEDIEVLRQFGDLASIALERANIQRKIAYQNQLLQSLATTTTSLVGQLDVDQILQNILKQAAELIGVPHGFIQLLESGDETQFIKCAMGNYSGHAGQTIPLSGLAEEVVKSGRIMLIEDYKNWEKRLQGSFFDDISLTMQAPLHSQGKVIGTLGLSAFGEKVLVDSEKLAILAQYANVASIALQNAIIHQKITRLAFHDTLTGLPNRAYLNLQLGEELHKENSEDAVGAVLFIDLDDLKMVNDNFGHTSGDSVIITAGKYIVEAVGTRAFVARMGGDEFIVVLAGEKRCDSIQQVADRLLKSLHREYAVGAQTLHLSASIGITVYPDDADSIEEILKTADSAMYAAKAAGRNCWRFYEPEMQKDAYDRMVLTNSLRHALERGELYLNYQPQINLATRGVVGFEALLRWNSQEHGLVPPNRFIPLAEQSGLIHPIGEWVVGEACRFARKLTDLGREDLHVAVNVSPRQLATEDFVPVVRRYVSESAIEPSRLEVEITENVLIDSLEDSIRKLSELDDLGVRLALDDFGTGFSSLTYLRSLPVKTLKIDKSFIDKILEDKAQAAFIESIIDMAHVLGLSVVAEGVETEPQMLKLTELRCDCVQGYLYSRPVSEDEAIRFLKLK